MKKLNYLFVTAAMMVAMVLASCSVEDLPVDPDAPKIHDGDELATAIAQYTEVIDGVPTLKLPEGVSVVLTQAVEMNAPLLIEGDEEKPANIKISGEGKFVTLAGIGFKNVVIDASELGSTLVTIGVDEPAEWSSATAVFDGVTVKELKKSLVATACKNYYMAVSVENSFIQVSADVTVFDFTKGGALLSLEIDGSTFWAPTATSKSFFSTQGGQKATDYQAEAIQRFEFDESTFYNFAKSKNFFSHRQSNQTWLVYEVEDCIFVNCGKKGQVIKGLNGGQSGKNPSWIIKGNVFNFDGEDSSADESTGDDDEPVMDSKAVVVKFADADNGNFKQDQVKAGDPFWYE